MKLGKLKRKRVLSIDPASHSYAFAVLESNINGVKVLGTGKINFNTKSKKHHDRVLIINETLPVLLTYYKPTHVVIEESIYIQNANTTRTLAYIVGSIWACAAAQGYPVQDVGPLRWKPYIGYKNVSKKEKDEWYKELGEKEAKKKASFERKNRVKRIIDKRIPKLNLEDLDIYDAIGIGIWGLSENAE